MSEKGRCTPKKDTEILEREGDANGLKARGIQKIILVNLAGGLPSP